MKHGIKETKEALDLVFSIANGIGRSLEDGKFSYSDLVYFFAAMQAAPSAMDGADKIAAELKDLDRAEIEELRRFAIAKFDIPQDEVEARIEKGLNTAIGLIQTVQDFIKG